MKNQRKNTLPKQGVAAFIVHIRDWLQGSQPEQLPESLEQWGFTFVQGGLTWNYDKNFTDL